MKNMQIRQIIVGLVNKGDANLKQKYYYDSKTPHYLMIQITKLGPLRRQRLQRLVTNSRIYRQLA